MEAAKGQGLAEARVLIIWPNGPGSLGPKLKSFIQQHRRVKAGCFAYVGHPIPMANALFRESEFLFVSGEAAPRRTVVRRRRYVGLPSLMVDWILTLLFLAKQRRRYDVCISMGLHLAPISILLRRLGVVKRAVSVLEEYRPQRHRSRALRRVHRRLTSWTFAHSDAVVQTSPLIDEALIGDGIRLDHAKQIIVPQPVDPLDIGYVPLEEVASDSVVWVGQLTADYGFELVIEAMELVIQKRPGVVVNVISYTGFPDHLWKMIQKRDLEKHFRLLGYIKDEGEFVKSVRKNRVALALYHPNATSKRYADVFRPWVYMANGVPQIITRVPPVAAQIEEVGAGIVIDYDKEQLADAILALLTDDQLHHRCRQKGLELVYRRTTGPVLTHLLARLGIPADS